VLQRGVSPRIVRAEVDGTNGVTQVTGPQLRARFGLFDTWATFTYITSHAKKPKKNTGGDDPSGGDPSTTSPASGGTTPPSPDATGGQVASAARARLPHITGTIRPAKAGRRLSVERRDGRAWTVVGTAVVGRGGRYAATVPGAGRYRVALGVVKGPALDVR
jgi:stage II sporulation protein D